MLMLMLISGLRFSRFSDDRSFRRIGIVDRGRGSIRRVRARQRHRLPDVAREDEAVEGRTEKEDQRRTSERFV